jgi:hypothetical protein
MIISKPTTQGTWAASPFINPRPPLLLCHNHTTLIPLDTETTKSPYDAARDNIPRGAYAYQNYKPRLGGTHGEESFIDITRTPMTQAKNATNSYTSSQGCLYIYAPVPTM